MNQPLSSPVQCSVWLRAALWSHTGPNSYLPDGPASQECISNSVNSTYSPFQFLIPPDDGSSCLIGSRFSQSIWDSRPPPSGNKCFLVLHLCREIGTVACSCPQPPLALSEECLASFTSCSWCPFTLASLSCLHCHLITTPLGDGGPQGCCSFPLPIYSQSGIFLITSVS